MTFNTAIAAAAAPITIPVPDTAASLIRAAQLLLPHLEREQAIDARTLRAAMETAFAGSDADGAWIWKSAYDACEAAQVLFLRKFGPAIRARAATPATRLAMLDRLAALTPSQTRRSEESQALQQFSTPIALGFVASIAAALTPADLVLEPSAGTGLLAIFAEMDGASLALNELANSRAGLLDRLFPGLAVTRFDAAQIHDHLDSEIRPSVVLMNPPFSVAAHVEGRAADAVLRHIVSALARLAEGGRLVAITGANLSPDNPAWRDGFIRLQERGRVVFSAAIDGRVYARHGTTVDTRLTVIDRIPADDPATFPSSPGIAPDAATLLDWVIRQVPPRPSLAGSPVVRTAPRRRVRNTSGQSRRPQACPASRPFPTRLPSSFTSSPTGHRQRMPASAKRSMRAMSCSRSAFPERSRTRRVSSSRRQWHRSHRPNPATGRISRRRCWPAGFSRTRSSKA